MANILIVGASRGVGLATVKRALKAGHTVRALARTAGGIPVNDPKLMKIAASVFDEAALEAALEDVDAVVLTLGMYPALRPVDLFSRATKLVIAKMKARNIRRLIVLTGLGAGDSRGKGGFLYNKLFLPVFLKRIYDDKGRQEALVKASGFDWVIARPGLLTNGRRTEAYQVLVDPADWRGGAISRADVADFLVRHVDNGDYLGATPVLIG